MTAIHYVILSFNHPNLTEKCVESALLWVQPTALTLIHNGSAKENVFALQKRFPEIEHICLKENKGYSGGVNEGLKAGFLKQNWVFVLTNDCILLQIGLAPLEDTLLAPLVSYRNRIKTDSLGALFYPAKGRLTHCKSQEEFQTPLPKTFRYVPGSAFLLSRSVFERVGPFDESLGTYWEDVDYSMRVSAAGFNLTPGPHFKVSHAGHRTTRNNPYYTTYLYQRNRFIVSRRYCSSSKERIGLNYRFAASLMRSAFKASLRRDLSKVGFLFRALKEGIKRA